MTRVLVVDDEPDYPRLLDIILTKEGFDVRTAADGDEARRVAEDFSPDVLVIDWMLGGREDGLRVATALHDTGTSEEAVFFESEGGSLIVYIRYISDGFAANASSELAVELRAAGYTVTEV